MKIEIILTLHLPNKIILKELNRSMNKIKTFYLNKINSSKTNKMSSLKKIRNKTVS